jgi:hypothetical protein
MQTLTQWRHAIARRDVNVNEQALIRLRSLASDQLACLGLEDDTYARDWLESGYGGTSMALSLQMLEWTTLLPTLPPQVWHAMANDAGAMALPANLTRRVVAGATLAQWLGAFTGQRMHSPPDAYLGRWVPGRTAMRLLSYLRPTGTDAHHDAIRRMLAELTVDDWLLINAVW